MSVVEVRAALFFAGRSAISRSLLPCRSAKWLAVFDGLDVGTLWV
jgi:hypothetical protein